ncbi:conserved protein of unknown function [Tenacibaculum sp. 190524A02b]|uniref:hypothetical protein n=1 Tax=Tenacibaculum vairaonense TaxID=3137860 RepID=UPI0032B138B6
MSNKKKGFEETVISLGAMTAGAMGSRLIYEKMPFVKNGKMKRGILIATGLIGAAYLDRSSTINKVGQDALISIAATQTGHLLKDFLEDRWKDNPTLLPMLGNPLWDEPIVEPYYEEEIETVPSIASFQM